MGSSYQLIALLCFCLVHVCSAGNCLCSDHNELPIYTCDDGKTAPFGFLYYDGLGSHCLVEVSGLHAKQGWKAGLFVYKETNYQRIVYIQDDSIVTRQPCTKSRLPGHVDSEPNCYPQDALLLNSVNGGWTTWSTWSTCTVTCGTGTRSRARSCTNPAPKYNGAQCAGSATDSQTCSTNLCPVNGGWTSWTTWTPCPVTCGTGTVTRTRSCTQPTPKNNGAQCSGPSSDTRHCNTNLCPVPVTYVPVPTIIPSTKCDSGKITDHLIFGTSASHPAARACNQQSNTNRDSEALLLETCKTPHTNYRRWLADLKVVDHCSKLPQGEPLGVFAANGHVGLGMYAAFWRCTATSFEIVYQLCGTAALKVDVKSSPFTPDTLYTLKW